VSPPRGSPGGLAPYRALVGARFRMLLQYRAAAIGGVWTQTVFGLILIMLYDAFYRSGPASAQPLAFGQVASYVWIGQALIAMLPWNIDDEMRAMLRSGAVAYELCRPVDLYGWWYARALAQRTAPTLLRAVPMALIAALGLPLVGLGEWRLSAPVSLAAGLGFAAAVGCAIALAAALSVLLYISLLWTIAGDGMVILWATAASLCSGLLVPLPLLPDRVQGMLRWLPFAGIFDLPVRIYTGYVAIDGLALVLVRQLGWTLALIAAGRWLLGRGLRRIVVQGG
jgi:ABC-2 type transport system permease protein